MPLSFASALAVYGGVRRYRQNAMRSVTFLAVLMSVCIVMPAAAQTVGTTPQPAWRRTGLHFEVSVTANCFDATVPGTLVTSERLGKSPTDARITYANNYITGQRALVAKQSFDTCNTQTGSLFSLNMDGATALRFSAHDPGGRMVDHYPDYIAPDGSLLYAIGVGTSDSPYYLRGITPAAPGHLYVSTNDGQAWQERGAQFNGTIAGIAPVDAAPQSLYALVATQPMDGGQAAGGVPYALYFSADAGMTWEQRSTGMLQYSPIARNAGSVALVRIPGAATPPTTIGLAIGAPAAGPHGGTDIQLSADGGRTFTSAGGRLYGTTGFDKDTTFVATSAGIIRLALGSPSSVSLSTDGGATFAPLATPVAAPSAHAGNAAQVIVAPGAPNLVLFFTVGMQPSDLYLSQDGGKSWARLATNPGFFTIAPFGPPMLFAYTSDGLLTLDLGGSGNAPPMPTGLSVAPQFATALATVAARGTATANLGTATSAAYTENGIAILGFERGTMLFLIHQNAFYALAASPGAALTVIPRTFGDDGLTTTLAPGPRPNTFVPRLGFGKVWQDNPLLQQSLGYATGDERRYTDTAQLFQYGVIVADTANNVLYILNTQSGIWDSAALS